jgi:hypothetical protein
MSFSQQSYTGQGIVQQNVTDRSGENLARGIEAFGQGIAKGIEGRARTKSEAQKLRTQLSAFSDEFMPDNIKGTPQEKDFSKMFTSKLDDMGLSDLQGLSENLVLKKSLQLYDARIKQAQLQNQTAQRGIDQGIASDKFMFGMSQGMTPSQSLSQVQREGGVMPAGASQFIVGDYNRSQDQEQQQIYSNALGIDVDPQASLSTAEKITDARLAQDKLDVSRESAGIDKDYKTALIENLNLKRQQAAAEVGQLSNEQKTRIDSVYNSYIKAPPIDDYIKSEAQFKQLQDVILQKGSTGAQGLATVFAFMKSLDPDSVVREGEQQQAQKTGGLFDSIVSTLNDAVGKGKLTPQVRKNILDVSRTALQARLKDANAYRQSTIERQQAIEPGIDPTLYVSSEFNPTMYQVFDSWEEAQKAQAQGKIQAKEKIYFMEGSGFRSATGN